MLTTLWEMRQTGQIDYFVLLLQFLMTSLVVFAALPVHELAHGLIADRLGDRTARGCGRLSLNPLAHLDRMGTLMMYLVGFGYAKPVPVNPRNFKNPRVGMALTALAGPASNLLMAMLSVGIFRLVSLFVDIRAQIILGFLLVYLFAGINISLMLFNLLPIPPLDGYRILGLILPGKWLSFVNQYQQVITWGVMLLIFSGILSTPLSYLSSLVQSLISLLFGMGNDNFAQFAYLFFLYI